MNFLTFLNFTTVSISNFLVDSQSGNILTENWKLIDPQFGLLMLEERATIQKVQSSQSSLLRKQKENLQEVTQLSKKISK